MEKKNLRIIHLLKTLDIGGIERSVINLSNNLINECEFIGIISPEGFYSHNNIINKNVCLFQELLDVNNPLNFLTNLNYLIKIIKENEISIVHYHHRIFIPYIYLIKKKYPHIKIVHTVHNTYNDIINNLLIADVFIAVSRGTYDDIAKYKKNVKIILNGVEINENDFPVKELRNFGFAGRFNHIKGIPVLLKAFNELSKNYPGIKLYLRGEGEEYSSIKKYIEKHALFSKVILLKPESSLEKIYEDIDCIIQPSVSHEGFGLILIEAMQLGIPVITTNLGKLENIIDSYNALVAKPHDTGSLKNAMEKLINNKNLFEELSKNGLKTVKEFFDVNKMIKEYINEYYSILE